MTREEKDKVQSTYNMYLEEVGVFPPRLVLFQEG